MAQARSPALEKEDNVALLTDMIFSAVGARDGLEGDLAARAAAVQRVQHLLQGLIAPPVEDARPTPADDWITDIVFGRADAEHMFREPGAGA